MRATHSYGTYRKHKNGKTWMLHERPRASYFSHSTHGSLATAIPSCCGEIWLPTWNKTPTHLSHDIIPISMFACFQCVRRTFDFVPISPLMDEWIMTIFNVSSVPGGGEFTQSRQHIFLSINDFLSASWLILLKTSYCHGIHPQVTHISTSAIESCRAV